jgi:hypothetical protein
MAGTRCRAEHGVPVALNVGDLLIGEGLRLIAESGAPPEVVVGMLRAAADGHKTLSVGQGTELSWTRAPRPLSSLQVLDIFRQKTAPAFEVALAIGCLYARRATTRLPTRCGPTARRSAWPTRFATTSGSRRRRGDICGGRPSLPLAVGLERARAPGDLHANRRAGLAPAGDVEADRLAVLSALAELNGAGSLRQAAAGI